MGVLRKGETSRNLGGRSGAVNGHARTSLTMPRRAIVDRAVRVPRHASPAHPRRLSPHAVEERRRPHDRDRECIRRRRIRRFRVAREHRRRRRDGPFSRFPGRRPHARAAATARACASPVGAMRLDMHARVRAGATFAGDDARRLHACSTARARLQRDGPARRARGASRSCATAHRRAPARFRALLRGERRARVPAGGPAPAALNGRRAGRRRSRCRDRASRCTCNPLGRRASALVASIA